MEAMKNMITSLLNDNADICERLTEKKLYQNELKNKLLMIKNEMDALARVIVEIDDEIKVLEQSKDARALLLREINKKIND